MWSKRDRRQHRQPRLLDHVGRVEPPAEADLQQQDVGRRAGEGEECGSGGDLEEGDRLAAVGPLAFLEERRRASSSSISSPASADALVEAHQMGRGVDMHALARRLQHGAQIGDDRALAVGAGDMDDRRQAALADGPGVRAAARCDRATDRSSWDAAWSAARGSRSLGCGGLGSCVSRHAMISAMAVAAGANGRLTTAGGRRPGWRQQIDDADQRVAQLARAAPPCRPCHAPADIRRAGIPPAASRGWSPR